MVADAVTARHVSEGLWVALFARAPAATVVFWALAAGPLAYVWTFLLLLSWTVVRGRR